MHEYIVPISVNKSTGTLVYLTVGITATLSLLHMTADSTELSIIPIYSEPRSMCINSIHCRFLSFPL